MTTIIPWHRCAARKFEESRVVQLNGWGVIDWCGAVVHETGDRGRRKNRHAVDALASSAEEGRG